MKMYMYEFITFLSALEKVEQEHEKMKKLLSEIADPDNATAYMSAIEAEHHFDCEKWMERVRDVIK